MVNPFAIGNFAVSCGSELKKAAGKIKEDSYSKEIEKLNEQREKFKIAIDLIGKDYYRTGEDSNEFQRNALNYLAVVEHVSLPYSTGVYPIKKAGYYFINPKRIKDQDSSGLLVERIYPAPRKAISMIEKAVEECFDEKDFNYLTNFKKRKDNLVRDLTKLKQKIKTPYERGQDYSAIREGLVETVRETYRLDSDCKKAIEDLETKSDIRKAKIGITALAAIAIGTILGTKLKKIRALRTVAKAV